MRSTLLSLALAVSLPAYAVAQSPPAWKKIVINDQSPYEAAGAADFNGDGKVDVLSGDTLYLAPDWQRHKIREVPASGPNPHYYEDFNDLPLDVNGDGAMDIVTCTYFTRRVGWVMNPKDTTRPWVEHEIDLPGSNETGQLVDLNGDSRLDFLPNCGNQVIWYEVATQSPSVTWAKHPLGTEGAGHGVGVGDINADGRVDIICPSGWYEQPAGAAAARWSFHKELDLGAAGILIIGRDFDGDGKTDIVWGMGHNYGLQWLRQSTGADGKKAWVRETIDKSISQVHTLLLADLDGDGEPEVVTGKRVYAHEVEPGDTDAPGVYSYQFSRTSGKWQKRTLIEGEPAKNAPPEAKDRQALRDFPRGTVGTGLQMEAKDLDGDGDLDLLCPGKSGLYALENPRKSPATN